tara:strand:+ start:114 stop:422 length:309 start_codon:yes stop_codon:yes gene_type:complete
MLTISLKESIFIGVVTIMCAILIQIVVKTYGEDEIQESNIFYKHRKSTKFYLLLFCIGIALHIFVKYIEFDEWYCQKVCTDAGCKVLCTLPLNGFTNLLITE